MRRVCLTAVRRSLSSQRVEEADVKHIPPRAKPASASSSDPLNESLMERLSPHGTEILGLLAAPMMLALGVNLAREKGEANERDKRFIERIMRVKMEIAALEQAVPEELVRELQEEPSVAQYFKTDAGRQKLLERAQAATARAMEHAKEEAVRQFEARLWEEGEGEKTDATTEPKAGARASGEKTIMY